MDAFECIMTRRSIRKYLDVPIPWDFVGNILEAGKAAPSAGNLQDYRFIVVTKKPIRRAVAEACLQQYWMETAPVHIVICSVSEHSRRFYGIRGERLYAIQSSAAAAENMLITANNYGLGGCWVGAFEEGMLKRAVGIPDDVRPQAVITIGYPDEKIPEPVKYRLLDLVFVESYGARIKDIDQYLGYTSSIVRQAVSQGKGILSKVHKKIKGE